MTQADQTRRGAFDSDLAVQAVGPNTWKVLTPLIWTGTKGDTFTVPVGFVTDFATVPRPLRWLINTYGPFTRAAVLHDWLLVTLADWDRSNGSVFANGSTDATIPQPPANSHDADGIFRRVMQDLDVDGPTRWTMWTAVRWASIFNARRAYGRHIMADLPRMILVSVLAAGPVILGAVPVLVSLGLLRVATGAIRLMRPGHPGRRKD